MLLAALALALAQASVDVTAGVGLAPGPAAAASQFPYTSNAGVDLGCLGGLAGSTTPEKIYDSVHNEWIVYNVSRCTGGYIRATNQATGKFWRVEIGPGGELAGNDLHGDKWTFDRARRVYVNLHSHAECSKPDYRDMCSG